MARTEGGINNLNSDDPVLNRQMFAEASNQAAPTLEEETIKVDTLPEVKAANEITEEDIERFEPVSQPPSVTTTVSTQTQPVLTNQEKLSMFLLPMAAELLNARTPMGASNFQSFLQAAGRGLARVPQQIMAIKQLEAKGLETKAATKPLDYVFTKPFTIDGVTYKADQRAQLTPQQIKVISQVDATAVVPYDKGTTTKDALKKVDILKDFTIGGTTYKKGADRQLPESVIRQQLKIDPDTFGELQEADKEGGKKKSVFLAQDITLPSGKKLAKGQQQMTDKEIDDAQKTYPGQQIFSQAPTGTFRQVAQIDSILDKIKLENVKEGEDPYAALSNEDVRQLYNLIQYVEKPTKITYTDSEGRTVTEERKPMDILGNYKRAYGEDNFRNLLNRIILTKPGEERFERSLAELEDAARGARDTLAKTVKTLGKTEAETVSKANSALQAIRTAEDIIIDDNGDVRTDVLITPAQRFTQRGRQKQKYVRAIEQAVEILIRSRSGAAVPEQEFQRYKIMYTPSVFDSDEVAKFKIQSLKKEFAEQVRLLQEGRSIELSNSIKQDKDGNITSLQFLANEFKGQEMNEQTIKELLKKIKKDDDGFTEFKRNE